MDAVFSWLTDKVSIIITALISWLPDSPFSSVSMPSAVVRVMGYVNYFLPLGTMATILGAWGSAVAVYYAISIILRMIRAIE